jgi:hypothetical protein
MSYPVPIPNPKIDKVVVCVTDADCKYGIAICIVVVCAASLM